MVINFAELKKFFLYSLIGSLVVSAIVAVSAILIGTFNETTTKVFITLLMVILHSLISLAFIWDDSKKHTFERLAFFTNVLFLIIVLSFITSILSIWSILPGELVAKLYSTYFVVGFAALHADILSKALHKESFLDWIIYANFILIGIVILMLMPVIYIDHSDKVLGEFYFRALAAISVIDGTLSILTIIFYKLYIHKHPQEENVLFGGSQGGKEQKKGLSVWIWILAIYLLFQVASIFIAFSSRLFK